jgi:hypothetical protein
MAYKRYVSGQRPSLIRDIPTFWYICVGLHVMEEIAQLTERNPAVCFGFDWAGGVAAFPEDEVGSLQV